MTGNQLKTRDDALDAAKGIAILAVVISHMLRGLVSADLLETSPALRYADTVAYGFHVQTFLIIAGYFAFSSAHRPQEQMRRLSWLYYAYIFWSILTWGLTAMVPRGVNNPPTIDGLLSIPFQPYLQYWFLIALMQGTVLLAFLRNGTALLSACVLVIILIICQIRPPAMILMLDAAPFVLVGAWLRCSVLRPAVNFPAALICLAALLVGAWNATQAGRAMLLPYDFILELCGCYAAFAFASMLVRVPWIGAGLCLLGRQSLTVYLTHVFAGAGTRIILTHLAPDLPVIALTLIVIVAALAGPLLFARFAENTGTQRIFGLAPFLPASLQRQVRPA